MIHAKEGMNGKPPACSDAATGAGRRLSNCCITRNTTMGAITGSDAAIVPRLLRLSLNGSRDPAGDKLHGLCCRCCEVGLGNVVRLKDRPQEMGRWDLGIGLQNA